MAAASPPITPHILTYKGYPAMSDVKVPPSRLRFNFGFLLEANVGAKREIELAYPEIRVASDLTLVPLEGMFEASRTSRGIYVRGELHTRFAVECARCLEDAWLDVAFQLDDLFYYPPHEAPPGEQVVGENGFIDLAPLVRELSLLEIPSQPFCRSDCRGLCAQCGHNLNEGDCDCRTEEIDPRLAALQQLLSK
jgi:uncharacterized protein